MKSKETPKWTTMVRLGNRTYRDWRIAELTLMGFHVVQHKLYSTINWMNLPGHLHDMNFVLKDQILHAGIPSQDLFL